MQRKLGAVIYVQAQVKQMQVCECKRKCVFSRFVGLSTRRGAAARLEDRRLGSHRKAKHSQIFATSNKAAIAPQNLIPTCPAGPTGVLFRVLMFRFGGYYCWHMAACYTWAPCWAVAGPECFRVSTLLAFAWRVSR